jgi:hypothetical protein
MTPAELNSTEKKSSSWFGASERWSGWLLLGSVALAGLAAVLVARNTSSFDWAVVRLSWLAVLILAGGATIGSERLVASSAVPVLAGLLLADSGQGQVAWAESLVVGCVWFVAVETALGSVEGRGGLTRDPSVITRRVVEVATVVALATAVGLVGLAVGSFAPERSLLVRAAVASLVLVVLFSAARRLSDDKRTSTRPSGQ